MGLSILPVAASKMNADQGRCGYRYAGNL